MRSKKSAFLIAIFISAFLFGCDKLEFLNPAKKVPATTVKGTVIAKVANMPITLEQLNREVDTYNAAVDLTIDANNDLTAEQKREQKKEAKIDTREKKVEYLKNVLVRRIVFYQAALDKGLDRREDISEVLERTRATILAQEMEKEITKDINVGLSEVDEAYKNVKEQLKEPEVRKVRELVVKTQAEANQALLELLQGADFSTVAREHSIADSAKNGGDMGYIRKGQRGANFLTFDDIVFSPGLQQGGVSSVFKGPDGYYLVKIEGVKEGRQPTLSEVQDRLKEILLSRKVQEELDKFYSRASRDNIKVEIYESEIK